MQKDNRTPRIQITVAWQGKVIFLNNLIIGILVDLRSSLNHA